MTDNELILNYANGCEESFKTLFNRHYASVFGFILKKVHDSHLAEDLTQSTFMNLIRAIKRNRYCENGKFQGWLMTMAYNITMDHFRSKRNKFNNRLEPTEDFEPFDIIPDESIDLDLTIDIRDHGYTLRELARLLPEDQKKVLMWRIEEERSFQDIANEMGISINTALGMMRYATIGLKKLVDNKKLLIKEEYA